MRVKSLEGETTSTGGLAAVMAGFWTAYLSGHDDRSARDHGVGSDPTVEK